MKNNKILTALIIATQFLAVGCKPNVDNLPDVYGKSSRYYISKNKKHIYASDYDALRGSTYSKIREADAKKFIVLGYSYGKDDKHVFYREYLLEGFHSPSLYNKGKIDVDYNKGKIDVESFVIGEKNYPKDKNRVYRPYPVGNFLEAIEGANPDTFDPMDDKLITRDDKHYFYYSTMIDMVDYDSFVFFPGRPDYGKDKHRAYMLRNYHYVEISIINNANPETFEVVELNGPEEDNWTRDDKHYFYMGKQHNIDYDSFQELYGGVVIDKNHVYRYGKIIEQTVEEAKAKAAEKFKRENPDVE